MTAQEHFISLSKNMVVLYYNQHELADDENKIIADDVGILYFYEYDDDKMEIAMLVKEFQHKIYKVIYDPHKDNGLESFIFLM